MGRVRQRHQYQLKKDLNSDVSSYTHYRPHMGGAGTSSKSNPFANRGSAFYMNTGGQGAGGRPDTKRRPDTQILNEAYSESAQFNHLNTGK